MLDLLCSLHSAMSGGHQQQAWAADQPELARGTQASRTAEGASEKADLIILPMSHTFLAPSVVTLP